MTQPEFLPTTREAMDALGWNELDILLVTGDAYVDHHSFAASILGRWLLSHGFKTGIVAQPSWESTGDIGRMGRPRLFAGVTAGALDSLVAHYTAFRKKRSDDAYSPGGRTGLRPNRAAIVYTGLVRQAFPGLPVVAGGVEASLRRASHYDFWSDSLRRSVVLDSKADAVLYGMGERTILALAGCLAAAPARQRPADAILKARLPGTVYAVHPDKIPAGAEELPSHEAILDDAGLLVKATLAFERQMLQGSPCLVQRSGGRAVVFEPPPEPLATEEMDALYALPFARRAHPGYTEEIPAVAMMEDSVVSHRGCAGGCSFCSIALHQGRTIQSRSEQSVLDEVARMASRPGWKGSISDVGGPSANMWNAHCEGDRKNCARASCLFPKRCRDFRADQEGQAEMLRRVAGTEGVRHVRVASGVRHDLALESESYMRALVGEFTGGQLKIAPEHLIERVLRQMRKPGPNIWNAFIRSFEALSKEAGKEQYLIPYLMSAFPGCTDADMEEMATWLRLRGWRPQQVQCFIPTPGTLATAMFFSKQDAEGRPIPVAKTDAERLRQHRILMPSAEPAEARESRPPGPERKYEGGDRPRNPQRKSDRPQRGTDRPRNAEGRPERRSGDRPDRPRRPFTDKRPGEYRNSEERSERPRRPYTDKRPGEYRNSDERSERPRRPFTDKRPGEFRNSEERSERPRRPYTDKRTDSRTDRRTDDSRPPRQPRSAGSRPYESRPSEPGRFGQKRDGGAGGGFKRSERPGGRPERPGRPGRPDRPNRPGGGSNRPSRPNKPGGGFRGGRGDR